MTSKKKKKVRDMADNGDAFNDTMKTRTQRRKKTRHVLILAGKRLPPPSASCEHSDKVRRDWSLLFGSDFSSFKNL